MRIACSTTAPAGHPWRSVDGRLAELTWPELVIRRTRVGDRDLLILVGMEPDYRWRELVGAMTEVAAKLGVAQWISLGAIPAAVPHTRPVPILGTESAPGLLRGDVPGGSGRRAARAVGAGVGAGAGDVAQRHPGARLLRPGPALHLRPVPGRGPRPARGARPSLGVDLPEGELADESQQLRTRLDTAAAIEETTRTYVERLESMVDEQRLPAGDDLIADIERFLADRGGETQR